MGTYLLIGVGILIAIVFFMNRSNQQAFKTITPIELRELLKNEDISLIDVRTPREIAQGVIGNPLKIELSPNMKSNLSTLDKNKKYVVYCRSGRRSAMASGMMVKMGFTDVSNLAGGIMGWK